MDSGLGMNHSTFLFATPTWTEGVGRLLDFGDTLTQYNDSVTPEQADYRAIAMDWRAVGADILSAIDLFVRQRGLMG
jgi:hypothetical protein